MAHKRREVEEFLEVGAVILLHSQPSRRDSPRFRATLRGWRKPQHLILDRPRAANNSYAVLDMGAPCVLRFLREGYACACESQILGWDSHRNSPYLRVRWPKELSLSQFRQFERVAVKLPCMVKRQDGLETREELRDLSVGGCSVYSARICAEGAVLSLDIELPDGVKIQDLKGLVRNVRESKDGFLLGIQFLEGQDIAQNDLMFFVTSTLSRRRTEYEAENKSKTILLIDESVALFDALREPLKHLGLETVWAGNLVDALYRLRMLGPEGVLIRQEGAFLSGLELCRLIRSVSGLEKMPLWVYGSGDAKATEACAEAGATGCFPTSSHLVEDIAFTLAERVATGEPVTS